MKLARSSMAEISYAIDKLGDDLWVDEDAGDSRPTILAAQQGEILFDRDPPEALDGRLLLETVDLFARSTKAPTFDSPGRACGSCRARSPVGRTGSGGPSG